MDKIYFEMTEAEKQYNHIMENIDYAICVISEGIGGIHELEVSEVIDLQAEITDQLIKAQSGLKKLLDSVEKSEVGD